MKKTKREDQKLSIEVLTVRPLASQLTDEQLRVVNGGAMTEANGGPGSSGSRANC